MAVSRGQSSGFTAGLSREENQRWRQPCPLPYLEVEPWVGSGNRSGVRKKDYQNQRDTKLLGVFRQLWVPCSRPGTAPSQQAADAAQEAGLAAEHFASLKPRPPSPDAAQLPGCCWGKQQCQELAIHIRFMYKHCMFTRAPATADLMGPLALPVWKGQINLEVR